MFSSNSFDRKHKIHNFTDIGISPPQNKKVRVNLLPPAASFTENIRNNSTTIKNIPLRISQFLMNFNSKNDTIPKNAVINKSVPNIKIHHPQIRQCSISSISKHDNVSVITDLDNSMSRTMQKRLYLT